MRCDDLKELIHLHAIDLLDAGEEAAIREHLDAGCPRCAAEMAAAARTVDMIPFALPEAEPSPMAKARLMAAVQQETRTSSTEPVAAHAASTPRPAWVLAAAASAAAALISGVVTGSVLMRRQDELLAQMATLERQVREARESIHLVSSPVVKVVNLIGQGNRSGQTARLFWDPTRGSWQLYTGNLPAAPSGRTYQLWVITDGGRKISAGLFSAEPDGVAAGDVVLPGDAGSAVVAGVTVEPEGGSPQPTTQPFLVGSI